MELFDSKNFKEGNEIENNWRRVSIWKIGMEILNLGNFSDELIQIDGWSIDIKLKNIEDGLENGLLIEFWEFYEG